MVSFAAALSRFSRPIEVVSRARASPAEQSEPAPWVGNTSVSSGKFKGLSNEARCARASCSVDPEIRRALWRRYLHEGVRDLDSRLRRVVGLLENRDFSRAVDGDEIGVEERLDAVAPDDLHQRFFGTL